ncbi:pyruvate, phosphate dikinase, chloroplastic-like protein, partial [Corchorus olitorius]
MSSAMKGIVIRSSPDVYKQRLLKGKFMDHHNQHHDLLKEQSPSFFGTMRVPRCRGLGLTTRCISHDQYHSNNSNHCNGKKVSSGGSKQRRLETRAEAILTPVSDPTPTLNK